MAALATWNWIVMGAAVVLIVVAMILKKRG